MCNQQITNVFFPHRILKTTRKTPKTSLRHPTSKNPFIMSPICDSESFSLFHRFQTEAPRVRHNQVRKLNDNFTLGTKLISENKCYHFQHMNDSILHLHELRINPNSPLSPTRFLANIVINIQLPRFHL